MNALKAQWVVTAGLFPGHIDDTYSKSWQYTSQMHSQENKDDIYHKMMDEAHDYAKSLSGPLNVVTVEFIWL